MQSLEITDLLWFMSLRNYTQGDMRYPLLLISVDSDHDTFLGIENDDYATFNICND